MNSSYILHRHIIQGIYDFVVDFWKIHRNTLLLYLKQPEEGPLIYKMLDSTQASVHRHFYLLRYSIVAIV